jgi:hypothetical protein
VASFEVPGINETILLKRGANGRVLLPLERQVISRATSASPAVRRWSRAIPARTLGQNALAERLLKAIETTLASAAGRRPSKPKKKEGRRRA